MTPATVPKLLEIVEKVRDEGHERFHDEQETIKSCGRVSKSAQASDYGSIEWIKSEHAALVRESYEVGDGRGNGEIQIRRDSSKELRAPKSSSDEVVGLIMDLIQIEVILREVSSNRENEVDTASNNKMAVIQHQCFQQHERALLVVLNHLFSSERAVSEAEENIVDLLDYCMRKVCYMTMRQCSSSIIHSPARNF